ADHCRELSTTTALTQLGITLILSKAFQTFGHSIAVGHFVTQHAATANRGDSVLKRGQTARDCVWRCVMVDQRRRTTANGRKGPDWASCFDFFERRGRTEPPPNQL